MKKYLLCYLMKVCKTAFIFVVAPLMLVMLSSGTSLAQCACTPLNETFGSTASCSGFDQLSSSSDIKNHTLKTYSPGGASNDPNDGQYSIRCDGDEANWGWFGAAGTTMTDHTSDAAGQYGNFALINSSAGPTEFYHKTVTGLCASTSYTLTFYAGNIVRDNSYGMLPSLQAYTFPAGTAVTGVSAFSATGGTLLGSTGGIPSTTSATGFVWNTYSYTFTTGAGETSIDVVLTSLNGNNAGGDFALDDVTVTKTSGSGCTLPVELLSFTAERITPDAVRLDWKTSEEINASHFVVERSEDGSNFSPIGQVKAQGNTAQIQTYSFIDMQAFSDKGLYYRLHAIDLDGKSKYSEIIKVGSDESLFEIYPNPLGSGEELLVNFSLTQEETSEVVIAVMNSVGTRLYSATGKSNETIKINTRTLSRGIYIIELSTGGKRRFEKLIIE